MKKNGIIKTDDPAKLLTTNQEKFKALVKNQMPEFVAEIETKEDIANAMFEAGQELYLVVEDMLRRYHRFTPQDLEKLRREVKDVLSGVKEYEKAGLNLLSPSSVEIVGDMHENGTLLNNLAELAQLRGTKNRMARSGLEYPTLEGSQNYIKQLVKKNRKK